MKTLFAAAVAVSMLTGTARRRRTRTTIADHGRHERHRGDHGEIVAAIAMTVTITEGFRNAVTIKAMTAMAKGLGTVATMSVGIGTAGIIVGTTIRYDRRDAYRAGYVNGRVDQHRYDRGRYIVLRGYVRSLATWRLPAAFVLRDPPS